MTVKNEIEKRVSVLKGKTLWRCLRAADMATFAFGQRRASRDYKGNPREVGEWALHVQCAWRISRESKILIGDRDLYYPPEYQKGDVIPEEFDWDSQPNLRDKLLTFFFENGTRSFMVISIEVDSVGGLNINLGDGFVLEVFPNNTVTNEYWRLFEPDNDESHLVVTARGLES